MTRVTLLYAPDCPNWRTVDQWLRRLAARVELDLEHRQVARREEAEQLGFPGSPTVLVDGVDPFPSEGTASLSCRLYAARDGLRGLPPEAELEHAVLAAAAREGGCRRATSAGAAVDDPVR